MKKRLLLTLIPTLMVQPIGAMEIRDAEGKPKKPATTDANLDYQLIIASRTKHIDRVALLLASGANINAQCADNRGRTPLMESARFSEAEETCKFLIEAGADVNVSSADGLTALILAAELGKRDICRLLLAKKANVHAQTKTGRTALIFCAQFGTAGICQDLLQAGALPIVPGIAKGKNIFWSALIEAARKEHKNAGEREAICHVLVAHQTQRNKGIVTALLFFKTHENPFLRVIYKQNLLKSHLENHTLKALLKTKDYLNNQTAYDYLPLPWLKPINQGEQEGQ